MCRHTVRTVCRRILLQSVHITPLLHVRLLNRPATSVWGLDLFLKTVKCCPVSHLLSASSCLVSLFNTPHICFNLLSHHVLSSASPAPLQTLSVLSLPPFMLLFFFFFWRGVWSLIRPRQEKTTTFRAQSLDAFCTVEIIRAKQQGAKQILYSDFDLIWPHVDNFMLQGENHTTQTLPLQRVNIVWTSEQYVL